MRKITQIIIHCSDSDFGNVLLINQWHIGRNFDSCGYHYIITNAYPFSTKDEPLHILDGHISPGRAERIVGAHCRGQNKHSLSICVIGGEFSSAQKKSLRALILNRLHYYGLTVDDVYAHCEFDPGKSCPGMSGGCVEGICTDWGVF